MHEDVMHEDVIHDVIHEDVIHENVILEDVIHEDVLQRLNDKKHLETGHITSPRSSVYENIRKELFFLSLALAEL